MPDERPLSLTFETASPERAELGESPVWSPAEHAMWWVDIPGRRVLRTAATDGRTDVWPAAEEVGFVALTPRGPVVGMETGLFSLDPLSGGFQRLTTLSAPGIRFNDAVTDPTGRLWAGTMDLKNERWVGELLRIEPDLTTTVIKDGMGTPNGLAADPERGRLYLSDSRADVQTVFVTDLDLATGEIGDWRVFVDFSRHEGRPDGATLDDSGNYWIAGINGGRIHVFSPEGAHLREIATPMADPTKPAFGGASLSRLFLTSKSGPGNGGALLAADVPFRGREPALFGGPAQHRSPL